MPERATILDRNLTQDTFWSNTRPLPLDDVNNPTLGGNFEPTLDFTNAEVVVQGVDRISPTPEPQEPQNIVENKTVFPSTGSIDFNQDFLRIDVLHLQLGMSKGQRLSHDPAIERARYERAQTDEDKSSVLQGVIDNMEKTLYERARSVQSTVIYYQGQDGQIHSPGFTEPAEVFLRRGVEYSKKMGFVDYKREAEEHEGWKEVMGRLFNPETPLGSKAFVISGPGKITGSAFTDNFADGYFKTKDPKTGQVMVVQVRFASEASFDKYQKIASKLDKEYFSKGELIEGEEDIYYKRHPIFIEEDDPRGVHQLFDEEFQVQKQALPEEKIQHFLNGCRLLSVHYAETICSKFFQPEKVREAFRAVVNKFDSSRKGLVETGKRIIGSFSNIIVEKGQTFFRSFQEELFHYGRMKVESMMVGCGLLADFSAEEGSGGILGKAARFIAKLGRKIAKSLGIGRKSKWFVCPDCDYEATGPVGNSCPGCGLTKEAYARSGGKTC